MQEKIKLADVRKTMKAVRSVRGGDLEPIPFTFSFITCDEHAGTGGEIRTVRDATLVASSYSIPKEYGGQGKKQGPGSPFVKINDPEQKRIISVHYRLITVFNTKEVVW